MNIKEIVDKALQDGYLTPAMEAEVGRICDSAVELSVEEYMSLDRLMGALLSAEVVTVPRKQFINVMEELVLTEAISQVAMIETGKTESRLDVGDIAAYALNRLPALYATSEEGANYQRQRAKTEMKDLIQQQVKDGIERNIDRPDFFPERQAIVRSMPGKEMVDQVSSLLQAYSPEIGQSNGKEEHN
jgi:Late competence development protein ComFB